jgi:hypothetical protein
MTEFPACDHEAMGSPLAPGMVAFALAAPGFACADESTRLDGAAPERIELAASLAGVVQQANAAGAQEGGATSRASYRGDVALELPGGAISGAKGKVFAHVRFGQGEGLTLRPRYTSTTNTAAFPRSDGSGGMHAIVAQAWYQLTAPLSTGRVEGGPRDRFELTFGKIDPFVFFDQNAVANDETIHFLNNAFVHNPLLDSGGDTGSDDYGFAPGVRIAYVRGDEESGRWTASLAAFGSGPGADLHRSMAGPWVIGQLEASRTFAEDLLGNYRAYAWTNGHALDLDGAFERHSGLGISIDQRVAPAITVWGRLGRELDGHARFDAALTGGAEIGGELWGRRGDAIGLAAGILRTSRAYREATADGSVAGYAASGTERIFELYYRWRVVERLEMTPDVQWVRRAAGDPSAPGIVVTGVRARVGF